jgi:hypothetical protein
VKKELLFNILNEVGSEDVERIAGSKKEFKKAKETFSKISRGTVSKRDPSVRGGVNPFLLTKDSVKVQHNDTSGLRAVMQSNQKIQYLDPANSSGKCNACPWSTPGCRGHCLRFSGHFGLYAGAGLAPTVRTSFAADEPAMYLGLLHKEITNHENHSRAIGKRSVVRLNGTSDVPFWELSAAEVIIGGHPKTLFSEYTKRGTAGVLEKGDPADAPIKYPNVFNIRSAGERITVDRIRQITTASIPGYSSNLAVSFAVPSQDYKFSDHVRLTDAQGKTIDLPVVKERVSRGRGHRKRPVSVGDLHDIRAHDPDIGGVVALREKIMTDPSKVGRKDTSGFIRQFVPVDAHVKVRRKSRKQM